MFKNKKVLIAVIIVAIIILFSVVMNVVGANKKSAEVQSNLTEVKSGSIVDKVKGTGVVSANEQYNQTSLVTGAILSSNFEEGDSVQEGDVLYTIDHKDLDSQINTAKINLEKSEESYRQSVAANNNLTTTSQYSGKVQKLYVSKGEFVSDGAKIADVIDSSNLILKIPFNATDISKINVGATANITLASNSSTVMGKVSRIYDSTDSIGGNRVVTYIEITVSNPGAMSKGEKAYATINGVGCNSSGEFINLVEKSIVSNGNGQITELNVLEGDTIYKGKPVMRLKNDQISNGVNNSSIAVKESQNTLNGLISQLDNFTIKAPAAGTVVDKKAKKGDNAAPATELMTLSDISNLYVNVEIDEIYISKVKIGQKTEISADALPNQNYSGEVVKIDEVGVAKNGVTYYPVKVRLEQSDVFKVGMNLSVAIVCDTKENAILIPKEALDADSVMLFDKGKLRQVKIETGIKDDNFIEIVNGLNIGDKVSAKRGN